MKKIALTLILLFSLVTPIYSQTAKSYFETGYEKYNRGDYKGAIQDYTKAIELNPRYALAYHWRGNAKFSLKDYRGAIQDYTKAIELDPKNAWLYLNRGHVKFLLDKYIE